MLLPRTIPHTHTPDATHVFSVRSGTFVLPPSDGSFIYFSDSAGGSLQGPITVTVPSGPRRLVTLRVSLLASPTISPTVNLFGNVTNPAFPGDSFMSALYVVCPPSPVSCVFRVLDHAHVHQSPTTCSDSARSRHKTAFNRMLSRLQSIRADHRLARSRARALVLTLHTLTRAPQKVLYWHNQLCLRNQRNRTRWFLYRSSVG